MKKTKDFHLIANMEHFINRFKYPLLILVIGLMALVPFMGISRVNMRLMIMILLYAMLGMGLNVLIGYTGQVSLGHAGFYAIGAYTNAILTTTYGWNFWAAALAGACIAAFVGLLLGMPTLRLSGTYLTIVTLGFGEIMQMVLKQWDSVTNGNYGIRNIPKPVFFGTELSLPNGGFYWLILTMSTVTAVACYLLKKSKTGRAFIAIKEDDMAANMMGIQVVQYKILAFVISAFITGLAGAFYSVINNGYIEPVNFTFNISIQIISVVIVGGLGTIRGMYFGSALIMLFPQVFRFLDQWRFVIYGLMLVLMMQFRPQGALGWQSTLPYQLSGKVKKMLGAQETSEDKPMFEAKDISMHFGGLVAVDHVSMHVNKGEIVALIGPNGAGKTTVFNMITGVYTITEGKLSFEGQSLEDKKPREIVGLGIARTFQNLRLFSKSRVIENVLVGMHQHTHQNLFSSLLRTKAFRQEENRATYKAIRILQDIGLGSCIDHVAGSLPYGDQRKVEIARAIATDARLLLLDEPAAGMNPAESAELLRFIRSLRDKGYTILLIEHDMQVVMNISDRIYVLDHGKLIAEGKPNEIANNPIVVEAYLGAKREDAEN